MRLSPRLSSVVLAGALALSVSACANNDADTGADTSAATKATPTPAAQIANLTGKMTEVTLDQGFAAGLKSLNLTSAPVGTA